MKRFRYLNQREFERLKAVILVERDRLIIDLLYETGCYLNELVRIKVGNINFSKATIFFSPKKTSSISKKLCNELKQFVDENKKSAKEFLFSTAQSKRISEKRVRQLVQGYSLKAFGEKINPKCIKYSHIADAFEKKLSPKKIQQQTGTGPLRITQISKAMREKREVLTKISLLIVALVLFISFFPLEFRAITGLAGKEMGGLETPYYIWVSFFLITLFILAVCLKKTSVTARKKILSLIFIFVLAVWFSFFFRTILTGYIIKEKAYTQDLNLTLKEDKSYTWNLADYPDSFYLTSTALSGSVIGNGSVAVYIEHEGERFLIFNSSVRKDKGLGSLIGVTGYSVEEEVKAEEVPAEEPVEEKVEEEAREAGQLEEEISEEVAEETAEEQITEEPASEAEVEEEVIENITENITEEIPEVNITEENITIEQLANETVEEEPIVNETLEENITEVVNETVEEMNITVGEENVTAEENITEEENITKTQTVLTFKDICVETCELPAELFESKSYTLIINVESGTELRLSEIRYSLVKVPVPEYDFEVGIKDAYGNNIDANIKFIEPTTKVIKYESEGKLHFLKIEKGNYNIIIRPKSHPIKEIEFEDIDVDTNITQLVDIDDALEFGDFLEIYAIDPSKFNLTSAIVTATAKGNALYKCKDWNFTEQACYGEWIKLIDITPGQEYSFILTPEDPGYGEANITNAPGSAIVCDISSCPRDVTDKVALDDNYSAHIKTVPPSGGYMNMTWNNSIPLGATINSVEFKIEYKIAEHPDLVLRWWNSSDSSNSSWIQVADMDEPNKWTTESIDLSEYINTVNKANDLLLQYYLSGVGQGIVDWVKLFVNYTIDTIPPSVVDVRPLPGTNFSQNDTVAISANVTDNVAVDNVKVNITWNNFTQLIILDPDLDNIYEANFTNTSFVGVYNVTIIANDTTGNVNDTESTWFIVKPIAVIVEGNITDPEGNLFNATIYVYNETMDLVATDDESYEFSLEFRKKYTIEIIPVTGPIKKLTYYNLTTWSDITDLIRIDDAPENMPGPCFENWTEAVAWLPTEIASYELLELNFSYGNDTNIGFWKCVNWSFDNRSCLDDNWTSQNISDGPANILITFNASDPGGGAGKLPDYTEFVKVYDVTNLSEDSRANNGTLVGTYNESDQVNFTTGRYRIEIFVEQIIEDAIDSLKNPYHDNIQGDWIIDMNGSDSPNITIINGNVDICESLNIVLGSGKESGTQKITWKCTPPEKTVSDMDQNDQVKFWYIVDIPTNVSAQSHLAHFLGLSKGKNNAEITNNFTTIVNLPPSQVVLYSPTDGNITLVRRPTFEWENATDPENDSLTYQIVIANNSNFTSPIINVSAINETSPRTNYTPIVDMPVDITLFWKVRAYDNYSYGNWSSVWNLTVQSSLIISLPINIVNFSTMNPGETDDTEDNSPLPLLLRNDGNVIVDTIVEGTDLWTVISNPSIYYQYKIGINKSGSFNITESTMSWTNMRTTNAIVDISSLLYQDSNDTAEIELKITVPLDEPPGPRNSTITLTSELAE